MDSLEGRVVVVTGAGRGLGRAHALALAEYGAKVVVNDLGVAVDGRGRNGNVAQAVADEINERGGEAVASDHDVADWSQAKQLIGLAVSSFGDLHALVNNAGILRDRTLSKMSEDEWDTVVRVVLKGHAAPSRHALAYWRAEHKRGGGADRSVIHTSSLSGLVGNFGQGNYGAAKLGLVALSRIMALEGESYGVRSNVLAPGASTRMGTAGEGAEDRDGPAAPGKVSPLVVWMTERDCPATSQIFYLSGPRLVVLSMPPVCNVLERPQGWTVEALREALPASLVGPPAVEAYIGAPLSEAAAAAVAGSEG